MNTLVVVLAFLVALDPEAGAVVSRAKERWIAAVAIGVVICTLMICARMISSRLDSSAMAFGVAAGLLLTISGGVLLMSALRHQEVVRQAAGSHGTNRAIATRVVVAVTPPVGFLAVATALDRGLLQSVACAFPAIVAQFLAPPTGSGQWATRGLRGALSIATGVLLTAQAIGGV